MNVEEGEVETSVEDALRRAQLHKVRLDAAMAFISLAIYMQLFLSDDMKYSIRQKLKRLRNLIFGKPPLTEEQIQEAARQVNIEAAIILRNAE